MADNILVTPGTGATLAADDVSGVLHPRVKLSLGADGSATDALGGAGAVAAGVQRVTLASDDPAVVSLAVMDDWDETNRCAVNLIASQVGVAGGAGANGATVQRVTVATDDGLHTKIGEVQASPTANTVLARLKDILTGTILAAGTALIGRVSASNETSTLYNGTTALTPKFAVVAAATSGANEIVAAVSSKKIRVLAVRLSAAGTVNTKWQSASTDKTGLNYFVANSYATLGYNPLGWLETASGEALNLNLSAAVAVGGMITYVEV